jgi:ribosomal protein L6P/L9E
MRTFTYSCRDKRLNYRIEISFLGFDIKVRSTLGWAYQIFPGFVPILGKLSRNVATMVTNNLKDLHSIWARLVQLFNGITRGYFTKVVLHGIVFNRGRPSRSFRRRTKLYRFVHMKLGFRHYVTCRSPLYSVLWAKKRDVTVMGPDNILLRNFIIKMRRLYWPDSYKGKGIQYRGERVNMKPGKIR